MALGFCFMQIRKNCKKLAKDSPWPADTHLTNYFPLGGEWFQRDCQGDTSPPWSTWHASTLKRSMECFLVKTEMFFSCSLLTCKCQVIELSVFSTMFWGNVQRWEASSSFWVQHPGRVACIWHSGRKWDLEEGSGSHSPLKLSGFLQRILSL